MSTKPPVGTTVPLQLDLDYPHLAALIVDELAARRLVIASPEPDTVIEAEEVRGLLGRGPGRPMSYPTLHKLVSAGKLHAIDGPDRRRLYFSRAEVEFLLAKKSRSR